MTQKNKKDMAIDAIKDGCGFKARLLSRTNDKLEIEVNTYPIPIFCILTVDEAKQVKQIADTLKQIPVINN